MELQNLNQRSLVSGRVSERWRVSSVFAGHPQSRQSPCTQEPLDQTAHPGRLPGPGSGPTCSCAACPTTQSHRALGDSAIRPKDVVPMGPRASLTRGPPPETPDTGQQLAQKTHSKDAASASPETAARPTPQSVLLFQQSSRINSTRKSDQGQPEGPSEA